MSQIYDDLLQTLKNLPQGTKLETDILKKLKNCRLSPSTLLCIHEVLRISAPTKLLDKKTITLYFMNLKLVSHNILIDIVVYKTILLLNTKEFIQFMSYMSDIKQKDVLISIFDVYVKENKLDDIFRFLIVNLKNQVFNELVQKDCFIEYIDKLEDKEFMKVFMTYKNRCNLRLRSISNKILKRKYITLLFDTYENKGNGNIKSEDNNKENGKIKSDENKENIKSAENNKENIKSAENTKENDNSINANSIKSGNKKLKVMTSDSLGLSDNKYTDASTLSLEMNILSCEDFLRFYDFFKDDKQVLLCLIQKRNCCLECANIINDLANDENNKVRAKAIKYADFDNDWILDASKEVRQSAIKRAIGMCNDDVLLYMFKGIMTKAQNEYVEALSNIEIDFKFLYDNRNEIGIKQYLVMMKKSGKKIQMRDINGIQSDTKKLRFYVKYFIHDLVDINQYLADDPYTAYLCLRDRNVENEHAKALLDNLHKVTNMEHYLRIVVYLSDYIKLNDSYESAKLIDDKDYIYYSIFDNILDIDIEMTDNVNFSKALFLAKHYETNDNAKQKIKQYIETNKNKMEVLQIVIYSNSIKLLGHAYKALDSIELTNSVSKIINLQKNTTGLCFYFLQGGNVTIYNPTFIIDIMFCIRNIKNIKENNRIKQITTHYVNKLSISDKNNLLGLVNELKLYRQAKSCEYTIHENQIDIRALHLCDYNMYYMCDSIKNQIKNGDECVVNVNRNDLYPVESQYQKYILQLDFTKA